MPLAVGRMVHLAPLPGGRFRKAGVCWITADSESHQRTIYPVDRHDMKVILNHNVWLRLHKPITADSDMSAASATPESSRGAFTLVELLVVIAIIAQRHVRVRVL